MPSKGGKGGGQVGDAVKYNCLSAVAIITGCCSVTIIVVVITLAVALSTQTSSAGPELPAPMTVTYSPGDTRFSPGSFSTCDNVRVNVTNLTNIGATLYLLDTLPELTDRDQFTIEVERLTLRGRRFFQYDFYLYPGSNASVQCCLRGNSEEAKFFFIKSASNFSLWRDNPSAGGRFAEENFTIANNCVNGRVECFSSNITNEEDYYFVFFNPGSDEAVVNELLQFERTKYGVPVNSTVTQCSTSESSGCNVAIPRNLPNNPTLLLVVDPPPDGNYVVNVDVTWECLDS